MRIAELLAKSLFVVVSGVGVCAAAGSGDAWKLSGTIRTTDGRAVINAKVTLTGKALPEPVTVRTGIGGEYEFPPQPAGEYTITLSAKYYSFSPRTYALLLDSDITDANFTSVQDSRTAWDKMADIPDRSLNGASDLCSYSTGTICRRYVLH